MRIDVKNPAEFSIESVRTLIASKPDTQHRQFRVSDDGFLYLSDDVGNRNLDGVKFRLETLLQANGYVGITASRDDSWVESVYRSVRKAWFTGRTGYIDE